MIGKHKNKVQYQGYAIKHQIEIRKKIFELHLRLIDSPVNYIEHLTMQNPNLSRTLYFEFYKTITLKAIDSALWRKKK